MNDNISYNLEKLVKIKVVDKQLNIHVVYFPEKKKSFWHKGKEGGFYWYSQYYGEYHDILSDVELNKLKESQLLINNSFYFKPKCILSFQENFEYSYTFNTYNEALDKAVEIKKLSNNKWIEINT